MSADVPADEADEHRRGDAYSTIGTSGVGSALAVAGVGLAARRGRAMRVDEHVEIPLLDAPARAEPHRAQLPSIDELADVRVPVPQPARHMGHLEERRAGFESHRVQLT